MENKYIDEDEESKIQEAESQWEAKFLYKPFVPLPNLSEYLGCIIKVIRINCDL